jgi:hypothetical protein
LSYSVIRPPVWTIRKEVEQRSRVNTKGLDEGIATYLLCDVILGDATARIDLPQSLKGAAQHANFIGEMLLSDLGQNVLKA